MKTKTIFSLIFTGSIAIMFTACTSSSSKPATPFHDPDTTEVVTVDTTTTTLQPESVSVTEITSEVGKEGEYDGGSYAEASFGVHLVVSGKAYDISIKRTRSTFEGDDVTYAVVKKLPKETAVLRAEIMSHPIKNFRVTINSKGEIESLAFLEEITHPKKDLPGYYKPAVFIWKRI